MTTLSVTTPAGETAGALTVPAEIFDVQANIPVMHQVVVAQLAAARAGTHSTKTRGEVAGGGKKPYRQKGTGRARQGSIRAPQFTGGGVSHGPVPRGYAQRTPKKMKAAALRGALSDRARGGNVHVLSALLAGDAPSTKAAAATLAALPLGRAVLVVIARADVAGAKSLRNLSGVHLLPADQLNTYDVLCADDVVFTRAALDEFLTRAGAEAAVETVAAAADGPSAAKAAAKKAATEKAPTDEAPTDAPATPTAQPADAVTPDETNEEEAK